MSWSAVAELIVIFWFFFHQIIIILVIYWLAFREWPFPKGYRWSSDLKLLNSFKSAVIKGLYTNNESNNRKHAEGDYYDDYDGIGSNSGPSVRHPKNRDRAYSGGSERFDNGGW